MNRKNIRVVSFKEDPTELLQIFLEEIDFDLPDNMNTKDNREKASEVISKATVYKSYFTGMATTAKILKRNAKAKKNAAEAEKYMAFEDVFKALESVAEDMLTAIRNKMTVKRLDLDEEKNYGSNQII